MKQAEQIMIRKITSNGTADVEDHVAVEEPLEIQLVWSTSTGSLQKNIAVTMRTPGDEGELALGFLFTEGIIRDFDSVSEVKQVTADDNKVRVILKENILPVLHNAERNFYTTSSCGICGKASIDSITTVKPYAAEDFLSIKAALLYRLPILLKENQQVFENTGGLHACALFSSEGKFILLKEDVGRHNALDKLIGSALMNGDIPFADCILLLSGRAGFELVQKAAMAGIRIVASVGAPSSLAVELARETNISLIGFLKNGSCNVYTAYHRIQF